MPIHPFEPARGRVEMLRIDSRAVADNLLGDPGRRSVAVYLPAGYDESDADYPMFVCLAGFTGSGLAQLSWQGFNENLPQRIDRLIADEAMGPVVLILPDGFTSLGGNQYVNSVAMGRWEDFVLDEMIPEVEARFRVRKGAAHRAVFGKSSGGYAALIHGMLHADRWGAIACHSGDIGFDIAYRRDFPAALSALARFDGDVSRFIEHLRDADKIGGGDMHALMTLAMGASYDPDASAPYGIRLPVDSLTCEIDEQRWSRWLAHDPLQMIDREECQAGFRRLNGIWIDCGSHDQYHLQYPARSFTRKLNRFGIEHVYEEFDGTHSGVSYRMDHSLPFLFRATTR